MNELQKKLFSMQDLRYKYFQCKLMPTVDLDKVIGVRTPQLRELAKSMQLSDLGPQPHRYYEEDNLQSILISDITVYEEAFKELDRFLPHVDNWATCDMISPKSFRAHPHQLPDKIGEWLCAEHTYTLRFGIGMLLKYYLDSYFDSQQLVAVSGIRHDDYYVKTMIAWYFATALAKQYDDAVFVLLENHLDKWTHNKAIQKAVESSRVDSERKNYLKSLKRK